MPVLSNARHERFAQGLAKGLPANKAYVEAGFAANDSNAIRLKENADVQARLREIQGRAASKAAVTVASLTERLDAIAAKAEGGTSAPMLGVAANTIMSIAKLNGLIVDKSEVSALISNMTPEQRKARIAELEAKRRGAE
jgi:hypothetical protein